jgi:carbonic anhydrase/acetyltransferase-like protein (isoleucine patch superfamily)
MIFRHGDVIPRLGARVYVAESASVIGDVVIGEDSSIWFSTVLRGDVFPIRIGSRSNIQDGSVVHVTGGSASTTVGDDVTVGHMVLLHGCSVGDRVLVGMGSVVLDGAVIESDSMLAAGSLLPPGGRVPAGTLAMGRPAKVVRELTDKDRERIREAGSLYVQYAQDFRTKVSVVTP